MLHAMQSNFQKLVWKIYFEPKKDSNSQEGHGWMIEDGQLLFDRMSDPLVLMELIVCKCNKMCKGPECQWFSNVRTHVRTSKLR